MPNTAQYKLTLMCGANFWHPTLPTVVSAKNISYPYRAPISILFWHCLLESGTCACFHPLLGQQQRHWLEGEAMESPQTICYRDTHHYSEPSATGSSRHLAENQYRPVQTSKDQCSSSGAVACSKSSLTTHCVLQIITMRPTTSRTRMLAARPTFNQHRLHALRREQLG